jgi:predicted glycogen debranching enzyme
VSLISFNANACQDVTGAVRKEWCETNREGGFVSSTILSVNTRRSHGLLVGQLRDPLGQYVLLSNLDETLNIDDVEYPLSTRIHSGNVFPDGYKYLHHFKLRPFPTWTYHIEDLVLEKKLIFLHHEQTVLVHYQIISGDEDLVRLELRPMTAFRHVEELAFHNEYLNTQLDRSRGRIRFAGLYFYHNAPILDQAGCWYRGIEYPEEQKLGVDFEEDLYAPFRLMYAFGDHRENYFCASLAEHKKIDFQKLVQKEMDRPERHLRAA